MWSDSDKTSSLDDGGAVSWTHNAAVFLLPPIEDLFMVATAPCLLTYFLYVEQLSFLLGISAASVMRVAPVANSLNGLIEYRKGGRGNV